MFDYVRYYLSPLTITVSIFGLILGDAYVWLGVATLPTLALLDSLLPRDVKVRKINNEALAYVPVVLSALLAFVMYCALAYRFAQGGLAWYNQVGAVLSMGWIGTIVGVPAFHELFHRQNPFMRNLGMVFQIMYMDATRDIAHVVGHHIDVGTEEDSDTAKRGDSLYFFAVKAMSRSFKAALRMESDALEKRGKGRWSIQHRVWRAVFGLAVFLYLMFLIGGWAGMLACLGGTLLARYFLENFNYFQHYGQVRVIGSKIEKRHVWNHLAPLSRAMTFEITNHADHHLNGYMPYYKLRPDVDSVNVPSVFLCFMAALVPPIWENLISKRILREWDTRYASPDEQALALEQNKSIGWPNWFQDSQPAK